ncbi:FadR/GntR family transcriptional regulator [Asticcacaulis machinosus]|uniref:FadR/GntR family transcriptional regulator n=1 Tax=Asticcacaulis machinosus TaxID=2984211 RepID=A0ABT5HLZ9_9CAUL|nr:FadR/GntR family transcriptional regulator [Asticcacaulis machinosus]MDC7677272.1 FadR/GntR family transcriptional regulator [Asticcacaulis machinosus]
MAVVSRMGSAMGNATQAIVQTLGTAIVTGQYDGQPFPSEKALCEQFAAARTIVREAVKMLAAKGLITSRPRQGIRIASEDDWNLFDTDVLSWLLERRFSPELLLDFMEMRLAVEPSAAALAATHASDAQKAAIREAVERMYAASRGEEDDLRADVAFHVAVLEASGNRFFKQTRVMIATALTISIRYTNRVKGVAHASAQDHDTVARAILRGEPVLARTAMHNLLEGAFDLVKSQITPAKP